MCFLGFQTRDEELGEAFNRLFVPAKQKAVPRAAPPAALSKWRAPRRDPRAVAGGRRVSGGK